MPRQRDMNNMPVGTGSALGMPCAQTAGRLAALASDDLSVMGCLTVRLPRLPIGLYQSHEWS
jgi:hypothetical protein